MWRNRSLIFWTRLITIAFMATGRLLPADDPSDSPEGFKTKTVQVPTGDGTVPIRVRESDPFKNVKSSNSGGKYDPRSLNFSAVSSMANKPFSIPSNSLSKSNSDFKNPHQDTFITKAYPTENSFSTTANPDAKASFPTTGVQSRNAVPFNKSYPTSKADDGLSRTEALASTTSTDQNRAAPLEGPEKPDGLALDTIGNKQYLGPGAQHVPDNIYIKDNVVISRMSGLPNRDLSMDEVRELINHETKPNTDSKPEESTKPLNDPGYKQEPLRDTPSPGDDDDKNNSVPPPGTMAAPPTPENSEPLPQR